MVFLLLRASEGFLDIPVPIWKFWGAYTVVTALLIYFQLHNQKDRARRNRILWT